MSSVFRHQPLKGLYLTYQLFSTLFVRIPLWVLLSIPRSRRPRKTWSIKRVFWVNMIRHVLALPNRTGPLVTTPSHLAITPGVDVNGIWVDPVPELITAELKTWAFVASVSPIRIPGYWIHKKGKSIDVTAPAEPGEKVIYMLHGGAYIRLSAHPKDPTAAITRGLLDYTGSVHRTFSVEYRLSSSKPYPAANPFPAALLDALAGYNYLVNNMGFSPSNIIINGDSAGANLGHALTRYLVENAGTPGLPAPPSALILLSPWCDLGLPPYVQGSSMVENIASDYINSPYTGGFDYAIDSFLGPHGMGAAYHNRYISPASLHPGMTINFKGFPRTFIVAGGAEMLLDQIKVLRDRMAKDLGEGNGVKEGEGKLRYYEVPDGVHDYLVFSWHEPERSSTLKEIAEWISLA
ncbi:Alpha/Beta hydrolase protein [Infundibulicybe gibba]|nr:Alpha/Beta hydrolase protein [Infundibulicybe gibba]